VVPEVLQMAPTSVEVVLDGGVTWCSQSLLVTISNTPRSGAGLELAPSAYVDDGQLDVSVYENMDQTLLLAQFAPVVPSGDGGHIRRGRAHSVEIRTGRPVPVAIETKLVGVTPARFSILPGALSVVVGNGSGLLQPAPDATVEAVSYLAHTGAPQTSDGGPSAGSIATPPAARPLQALAPALAGVRGRVSASRIPTHLLAATFGVVAAAALDRLVKRTRRT
jgi:hypothetical protein